jgi:hypothetical protein
MPPVLCLGRPIFDSGMKLLMLYSCFNLPTQMFEPIDQMTQPIVLCSVHDSLAIDVGTLTRAHCDLAVPRACVMVR